MTDIYVRFLKSINVIVDGHKIKMAILFATQDVTH